MHQICFAIEDFIQCIFLIDTITIECNHSILGGSMDVRVLSIMRCIFIEANGLWKVKWIFANFLYLGLLKYFLKTCFLLWVKYLDNSTFLGIFHWVIKDNNFTTFIDRNSTTWNKQFQYDIYNKFNCLSIVSRCM